MSCQSRTRQLSLFGRFPTYFLKDAFKLAAASSRAAACSLAVASKVSQAWVDPILYETIIIRDSKDYQSIEEAVAHKPSSFFETVVKRIYHYGFGFPAALNMCACVQYIAMHGCPRMCLDFGRFDSAGLIVSLLGPTPTYFARPLFNAVTTLHCHFFPWTRGSGHYPGQLADKRYIPQLSHLRLRFNPANNEDENTVEMISDILLGRPFLTLLVYEAEVQPEHEENADETMRQLAVIDDSRLIVLLVNERKERREGWKYLRPEAQLMNDESYPWDQIKQDYWDWREELEEDWEDALEYAEDESDPDKN